MSAPRGYVWRPEEFSLRIGWKDPQSRRYGAAVPVPGFYLTAGVANEGEAHWLYEDALLTPHSLLAIAREVDAQLTTGATHAGIISGREDGPLGEKLRPVADAGRERLLQRRAAALAQIERATSELEAIDASLSAGK